MTLGAPVALLAQVPLVGITRIVRFAICLVIVSLGSAAIAEPILLNGSTTVINMLVGPHQAEIEAASQQQIVLTGNGSQRGLADLIAGKVQVAMISVPLELEVAKINSKQPGAIDLARLRAHAVGMARVAFVVNPENPVRQLSREQITDVLVGKIHNWLDVGGLDLEIIIVTAHSGDGMRTMVENTFLPGRELAKDARVMTNVTQIPKVVAQVAGAIGIIAASSLDASVVEIKQDADLTTPLILVTIGDGTPQVRQVINAVTKLGQF
jgi:phosphate transport system substrate-binding protein